MRMSSYSMLFGGTSSLDLSLVKLQAQMQNALEKAARTASFADTLASLQSADEARKTATVAETKSTAEMTMDEYKTYLEEKLAAIDYHYDEKLNRFV